MLEALRSLDHQLLLAINHAHTPALDAVMTFASDRRVWFPFYGLLIIWLLYHFKRRAAVLLPVLIGAVALADSLTSRLFKPVFGRLRPCHAPDLATQLHLPDGCGGQFGFLSSHAANSVALAVFLQLVLPDGRFRGLKAGIFLWAGLLSYSRIYLAAHYPSDVLGGALVGAALAWGAARLFERLSRRPAPSS
ncbi:phosphatase PAP2 family protein [Hymenobacter baengnokdamensis]|uniref:phosphatase PAP2 family protein n=1 Tax=Hymenobacter baengnokdamensis TaxID=2615203 RepID=UPI001246B042|nr:phosphatase PAP2 family protein [Hymenobacter baengnokdamensis]